MNDIIVDNFAGGGGASTGIEAALGRPIDYAINHDPLAIAMHRANHPQTVHLTTSVWDVNPRALAAGRDVALGWFSPDCTFHSKARGGKPFRDRDTARRRRGLAWLVPQWMRAVRPRVVMLENVEEFADWGPLGEDGRPCPIRKGMTFRRWVKQIQNLGYSIDMRELRACDYGAPTTRKRLFVIARCDGEDIVFPEAMHGPGRLPYRTAAECIDWSIPCPSIFERSKPLAENTLRRIARGVMRYVVNNPQPFIVPVTHAGDARFHGIDEPFRTVTGANRGEMALVSPFIAPLRGTSEAHHTTHSLADPLSTVSAGGTHHALVAPVIARIGQTGGGGDYSNDTRDPLTTVTTKAEHLLVAATMINTRNGERAGQAPRIRDLLDPMPTVTAAGSQGGLVAAFLARHYGGHENDGSAMDAPMHTITTKDHHSLVTAFLLKFYGTDQAPRLERPLDTVTTKGRFGLVTVHGEPYRIVDIGMRMLQPRELFRAQSFDDAYLIERGLGEDGESIAFTKGQQVHMCGNSVPPVVAKALVRANVRVDSEQRRTA